MSALEDKQSSQDLKSNKNEKKNLRIGLLNINSIGGEIKSRKIDYVRDYLSSGEPSILALTEYIQTEENQMNHYFMNDKDFPIISADDSKRVGLAVPGYLRNYFEVFDSWTIGQDRNTASGRDKKSDKVAHILTVKFTLGNTNILISVVYLAPDISSENRNIAMDKILEYCSTGGTNYYMALGDFNYDQRIFLNRIRSEEKMAELMPQLVSQITRHAVKAKSKKKSADALVDQPPLDTGGEVTVSDTCIDLVFVSRNFRDKVKGPTIIKDTPSDHYLVECQLDFKVPHHYSIVKVMLDPCKRPRFKPNQVKPAIRMLSKELDDIEIVMADSTQSECMAFIEASVRKVLDKFTPLHTDAFVEKKVYRKVMHKDQHRANKKRKLCLNRFRKAILKAKRDPKNEKLQQLRKEAEQKWKEQVKIYRQVRKRCE